jgi:predicted ribosome quality control (RQC) complex YloA/Tae2 family protein
MSMIKNSKRHSVFLVIISIAALFRGTVSRSEEPERVGSLSALERRALMAQALVQQVNVLDERVVELRNEIESYRKMINELREELELCRKKITSLEELLAERDKKIEQQRTMLSVFRSGSFEYYEVRNGDTVESIAAQSMIYGDASRAAMIRQANNLSTDAVLSSGMILIIPRYPEGVLHEL